MLNVIALANTFAMIDVVLHPVFHFWVWLHPQSYERTMNLFVAGLRLQVTKFDTDFLHILVGTFMEAAGFWLLGAWVAILYNKMAKYSKE